MILLLQSALRALLLGAAVWGLLRLLKLRDARSETAAWTLVLAAAMAMPLLTPLLERWLPGTRLPLPVQASMATAPLVQDWFAAHAAILLWSLYGLGAALMLARLGTGLLLSQRLYRHTAPLEDGLRIGARIRIGTSVRSPMVFGRSILLPAEWQEWPEAKRAAVLAHEQCHLARGDFFLQLAANLYRAAFWFSPFAWWLQRELSVLAERASDAAAVQRVGDRASYAELLVEAARHAQGLPALVAMAKGPDIAWRVDRILSGNDNENSPGAARRTLAAVAVLAAVIAFAGAHAVLPAIAAVPLHLAQSQTPPRNAAPVAPATPAARPMPRPGARRRAAALPVAAPAPVAPPPEPEFTYNPRALLDGPKAAAMPVLLVVGQAK